MTRFKICGLRDADNAVVAADAGADFLGFNFVPGVRRQLTVAKAQDIISVYRERRGSGGPKLVGLFANQPVEDVNSIVQRCSLDYAQLCGDEPPDYWAGISTKIIKMVKVRDEGPSKQVVEATLARVNEIISGGHVALLDKYKAGALGGTGSSFDWRIARQISDRYNIMLAGGLSPDNVGQAIDEVAPWGVDVSSWVETDGVKDPEKIEAFASEVARADCRTGKSDTEHT